MSDLKLTACGDLAVENGDLVLLDGTAETIQRVLIYLQTGLEEYFFDTTKGVPYFQKIFGKQSSKSEIKTIFRNIVENIENVDSVQAVTLRDFDAQTRKIDVAIELTLSDSLETTTIVYTGQLPDSCDEDPNFPLYLADLKVWFDAQEKELVNQAGAGTFSYEGSTSKIGYSSINAKQPAWNLPNPIGNEENCISFIDTPFINTPLLATAEATFAFVIHAKELTNGTHFGLLSLPGYNNSNPKENVCINFSLKENGGTSKVGVTYTDPGGSTTEEGSMTTFENTSFTVIIRINGAAAQFYINGVSTGLCVIPDFPKQTTGDGYLGVAMESVLASGNFMNCFIGEFQYYAETLTADQIESLHAWLASKWDLS